MAGYELLEDNLMKHRLGSGRYIDDGADHTEAPDEMGCTDSQYFWGTACVALMCVIGAVVVPCLIAIAYQKWGW